MRLASALLVLAAVTPAAADSHVAAGYLGGRPIAGDAGGLDHALAVRADRASGSVELGLALEVGHAPGNEDESLTRFCVLPGVAVRRPVGELLVGGELSVGWQVVDGRTRLAGNPVAGTEARALRGELALTAQGELTRRLSLRGSVGVALDGIYPADIDGETRVGPFVAFAIVATL